MSLNSLRYGIAQGSPTKDPSIPSFYVPCPGNRATFGFAKLLNL